MNHWNVRFIPYNNHVENIMEKCESYTYDWVRSSVNDNNPFLTCKR